MEAKKIDLKTWFIIILGIGLIISFLFGQKNIIDYRKDEINQLHKDNTALLHKNDSINKVNIMLDGKIAGINAKIALNEKELSNTKLELQKLKNKKDETRKYANSLSADGVASEFSIYLDTRTESKDSY